MLEICRVVDARCQQYDGRVLMAAWSDRSQRTEKFLWIMVDGRHAVLFKQAREGTFHCLTVLQHIADAGGRTQVVFQHVILAVVIANQVGSDHMRIDFARHIDPDHLAPEMARAENQLRRDSFFVDDALLVIDIVKKLIERYYPLGQSAFQHLPLISWDDAWNQIEGKDALDAFGLVINRKRDPLIEKRDVGSARSHVQISDIE